MNIYTKKLLSILLLLTHLLKSDVPLNISTRVLIATVPSLASAMVLSQHMYTNDEIKEFYQLDEISTIDQATMKKSKQYFQIVANSDSES